MLRVSLEVGLAEEEELELRAKHRLEAERVRPLHLRLQHLPRRGPDRRPVVPLDVALHHHRRLVPGDPAQRREVGPQAEVAVAPLPACDRVPRHRIHLHFEREQVVAALAAVAGLVLGEEELGIEPLPHQPALHVGEAGDDRVDRAGGDVLPQLLERRHRRRHYTEAMVATSGTSR